jgi:hypothetical protein
MGGTKAKTKHILFGFRFGQNNASAVHIGTKTKTKKYCVWYFLVLNQTGHLVWYNPQTILNTNKTPTINKTHIYISPTTTQFSTSLATSSEHPWWPFWMQRLQSTKETLVSWLTLSDYYLIDYYIFQHCKMSSSGSNSRYFIQNAPNMRTQ